MMLQVDDRDHVQGPHLAPITLIEYGDYESPYSETAFFIVKRLQNEFGSDLRFVYRSFPQRQVHEHAQLAAEAAEAAGAQGRFWEMHDMLYKNQANLDEQSLVTYAETLGLDGARFASDLSTHAHADRVQICFRSGLKAGVSGTPAFFINGVKKEGDWSFEALASAIRRELKAIRNPPVPSAA
jgi:protein-disulfide isomerase